MSGFADERAGALVALLRESGLDAPGLATRLEGHAPGELLGELLSSDGDQIRLLGDDPAAMIAAAAAELDRWRRAGLTVVSVRETAYPANLRLVHDRPAALFVAGELGPAPEQAIAVIGTRQPSADGQTHAERLVRELVYLGQTVVSGLAAGIDTVAHRTALVAGGRTIAVIGTGHEHAYPAANRSLQVRLAAEQTVVSPFWPDTAPSPEAFRRRNGVMSGLARATVIVEASPHSGTRVQARRALGHGRPVCLMEPVLGQAWAAELASRPGVHVVASAAEVVRIAAAPYEVAPLEDLA